MEDSRIVALYHARNERAIGETAKKYGGFCHRIALNLLNIPEDADECVNDTYHAAWLNMPPDLPRSLKAYLGRIVRNLSISRYRAAHAQKRFDGVALQLSELEDCLPSPHTMERQLERLELSQLINDWLDQLSPDDRALFVRRYWYGDAVNALAQSSSQSPNQLSQRLLRLRKKLKAVLESEGVTL